MKNLVKSALDIFGYSIVNSQTITPKDLRGEVIDPRVAKYSAKKSSFILEAQPGKCIVLYRFSCDKNGRNPFIKTMVRYLENGNIRYSNSELEYFYNTCQPQNVAEMFNLEGDLHKNLTDLPVNWIVFPWENCAMSEKKVFRQHNVKAESLKRGNELSLKDGYGFVGPISKERGELEISTLINLTNSIQKNGYNRGMGPDGDIKASVLIDGDDYKFFIKDGNHRVSVLSALGFETIPLRILPSDVPAFIYRDEVNFWANVQSGLYTRNQALKVFDTIFASEGKY